MGNNSSSSKNKKLKGSTKKSQALLVNRRESLKRNDDIGLSDEEIEKLDFMVAAESPRRTSTDKLKKCDFMVETKSPRRVSIDKLKAPHIPKNDHWEKDDSSAADNMIKVMITATTNSKLDIPEDRSYDKSRTIMILWRNILDEWQLTKNNLEEIYNQMSSNKPVGKFQSLTTNWKIVFKLINIGNEEITPDVLLETLKEEVLNNNSISKRKKQSIKECKAMKDIRIYSTGGPSNSPAADAAEVVANGLHLVGDKHLYIEILKLYSMMNTLHSIGLTIRTASESASTGGGLSERHEQGAMVY